MYKKKQQAMLENPQPVVLFLQNNDLSDEGWKESIRQAYKTSHDILLEIQRNELSEDA